jgi:hypothetical protein
MSSQNIDVNGLVQIQRQYLVDLQALQSVNTPTSEYITDLSSKLNAMGNSYTSASGTTSAFLENQDQVNGIVNNELTRLKEKESSITNAVTTQNRMNEFNQNYRKVYTEYNKMVLVSLLCLLLYLGLMLLRKFVPVIPELLIDVAVVILFSALVIYIIYMFAKIKNRNRMNYDEIDYNSSKMMSDAEIAKQKQDAINRGNLFDAAGIAACSGPSCCSKNTYWDSGNSVCMGNTISGFASLIPRETFIDINGSVKAYTPFEFDSYSKL